LQFEDASFTYSRRYYWAKEAIRITNRDIKEMVNAYKTTFVDEVWEGKHQYIWPGKGDRSPQYSEWRKRMLILKDKFGQEITRLEQIYSHNLDILNEVRSLRDNLFTATSTLESRKSVELSSVTILQGHNIKLLTLVSIIFIPITFVASIFSMTNMPSRGSYKPFAITVVLVCLPFYLLIGSLNTTSGMEFWRSKWFQVLRRIIGGIHLPITRTPHADQAYRTRKKQWYH
jgi:hypothetical protein